MKFLFFFLGVPMMIMSFFEAIDVLPYAQSIDLIVDGHEVVLSQDEQAKLEEQVFQLFENSHTMPAFGVMFDEMYREEIQNGKFVSLKFGRVLEVNELSFDELVFRVEPDFYGFNLYRGVRGIFQGRCIYIDLVDKNMQELFDFINNLSTLQDAEPPVTEIPEQIEENQQQNENKQNEVTDDENKF